MALSRKIEGARSIGGGGAQASRGAARQQLKNRQPSTKKIERKTKTTPGGGKSLTVGTKTKSIQKDFTTYSVGNTLKSNGKPEIKGSMSKIRKQARAANVRYGIPVSILRKSAQMGKTGAKNPLNKKGKK